MAKVLVTGATGFVGRHVIKCLKESRHKIVATGNRKSIENCPWLKDIDYISRDLSLNCDDYYTYFGKPDHLVHLAWRGLPNYNELFHIEENLWINYSFLKNMIVNGLKDLTVTGTCFEYGLQEGELNEEMACMPVNSYAIAKDSLRRFLELLNKDISFNFKWLRLFYMYGNGQSKTSLIPQLEAAIERGDQVFNMSKGEQVRDYLTIREVAGFIVSTALQNKTLGIINCCSGKPLSVKKLVEGFLKKNNSEMKLNLGYYSYSPNEPMKFWGSTKKLKAIEGKR